MRGKLIFCALLAVSAAQITVAQSQSSCALPDGLSTLIASKFPNTHVVSLSDLNPDDKMRFRKSMVLVVPASLALISMAMESRPLLWVLLRANGPQKTELVVAHRVQK